MEINFTFSLKQSIKNSPITWMFYLFEVLILISNYVVDFQSLILKLIDILVPEMCIFTFLLAIFLITFFIHQLIRKKPSRFDDQIILVYRKGSKKRKFIWVSLIFSILLSSILIRYIWMQQYNLPGDSTQIRIFVDDFDAKGWEKLKLSQRIKTSLKQELAEVLPEARIEFLPNPPKENSTQEERLAWACKSGASLVIYGKMDEGKFWPNVKICSEIVPETNFEDFQTQVSLQEVTDNQMKNGNYFMLPDRDKAFRFCFLDSLAIPRTNYLTLFSLGMIILFDDIPSLTPYKEKYISYMLFSKAVEFGDSTYGCDLNYCDGLFYKGLTASGLISHHIDDKQQSVDYFAITCDSYAKALIFNPSMDHALNNWGSALKEFATDLELVEAKQYYLESFDKYDQAVRINSNNYNSYYCWGNALWGYAKRVEDSGAEQYFLESSDKYAMALNINPNMYYAFSNWGMLLLEFAEKQEGAIADSFFQESFIKFSEAVRIKPDYYPAYNNWGFALKQYAIRLDSERSDKYIQEAFEKYAKTIEINQNDYYALVNWGDALVFYANRLEGEKAKQYYYESFEKYSDAIQINRDMHYAYYWWGIALGSHYFRLSGNNNDNITLNLESSLHDASQKEQTEECRLILIRILERVAKLDPSLAVYIENFK